MKLVRAGIAAALGVAFGGGSVRLIVISYRKSSSAAIASTKFSNVSTPFFVADSRLTLFSDDFKQLGHSLWGSGLWLLLEGMPVLYLFFQLARRLRGLFVDMERNGCSARMAKSREEILQGPSACDVAVQVVPPPLTDDLKRQLQELRREVAERRIRLDTEVAANRRLESEIAAETHELGGVRSRLVELGTIRCKQSLQIRCQELRLNHTTATIQKLEELVQRVSTQNKRR